MLVVVAGVALLPLLFSSSTGSGSDDVGRMVQRLSPAGERVVGVVLTARGAPQRDSVAVPLRAAATDLRGMPGVARVLDPTAQVLLRTGDGRTRLVVVDLTPGLDAARRDRVIDDVAGRLHGLVPRLRDGGETEAQVVVGSASLLRRQADAAAARDLGRAELVTLPVLLAVTVVVCGGLTSALLPAAASVATVGGGLVALAAVGRIVDVASYSVNVVTMTGFALAVDYALLVLTRFAEERGRGLGVAAAVRASQRTAGRTVTLSGLTVAACLSGLLLTGDEALVALAVGGAAAALVAVAAARTLLPVLLLALGHRVRPRAIGGGGGFARLAHVVSRRPLPVAAAVTALLAVAALPLQHLDVRHADPRSLPPRVESRSAVVTVLERFPLLAVAPVTVLVRAAGQDAGTDPQGYAGGLARAPGVLVALPRGGLPGGVAIEDLVVDGDPQGPSAQQLVRRVRADHPPGLTVGVVGEAARLVDHRDRLRERLPLASGVVVLVLLVLLFGATGSVAVPVKAVVVAALSLSASVGVLVWGFQDGHLPAALGGGAPAPLQLEVPLVVVALALGLGLDYEVFLLGRVQEAWRAGASPVAAVADGLQRTGRVVTTAALLVVVVLAGFAAGDVLPVRQLGVGLAVAVILDVTLVRCLLVPAAMALLGARNWWAPAPLVRLRARLGGVPGWAAGQGREATPVAGSTPRRPVR